MSEAAWGQLAADLPDYERPPVSEVVLGVQFVQAPFRAIDLGSLRDLWASEYPHIEEHPPLDPTLDGPPFGQGPSISFGPPPMMRYWWISADGRRLIQVQQDRFIVNWRRIGGPEDEYPRYPSIRATFQRHLAEFGEFVLATTGQALRLTQCEVTYINDLTIDGPLPQRLSEVVRMWADVPEHHLGSPIETRLAEVFAVPTERGDARLFLTLNPIMRPAGTTSLALTLSVRGTPGGTAATTDALAFLDSGREHIVHSFTEITTESMHRRWGLLR